jgi:hypothetical protein
MGNFWEAFVSKGIFPGPNVRVTADSHAHSESALVVDPKNADRLLGASKRFTDPQHYVFSLAPVVSTDGGSTWPTLPPFSLPANHDIYTDPSTTFDTSGAAWVMGDPGFFSAQHQSLYQSLGCSDGQDIQTTHMLAQKSVNDGAQWSPVPVLGVRCSGDDKGWLYCDNSTAVNIVPPNHPGGWPRPRPASPYHGRLYAVWAANTPLRFARSLDGGQTWVGAGNQPAGADIAPLGYAPDLAIGRDGTLHVFSHYPNSSSIQYWRSQDGGQTFVGDGTFYGGLPNPRGVVTNLVDISSQSSSGGPITQSGGWPVFEGANFRVITIVAACCFGDQGVAVAWADARSGHSRIYYRLSTDGGTTWLGDPSGTPLLPNLAGDSHQFHPQLATTGSDVIGCAMYSYSKTAIVAAKPGVSVLVGASFDDGSNFDFTPITDQPWDPSIGAPFSHGDPNVTFIGEYFGFDAGKTEFHVLWTDTRHNNQDLFYCRVDTQKIQDPRDWLPELVATYVSPGVSRDGGGFVIVGGHIIRIPPWDPLRSALDVLVAINSVSRVGASASATRAREALYGLLADIANQAKKQVKEG